MYIRIMQEGEIVVDLPAWKGPIPRVGDYLFHPNQLGEGDLPHRVAGCVSTVTWCMHDRVYSKEDTTHGKFVQTDDPYVEIHLR